jgi:hypothetical protein
LVLPLIGWAFSMQAFATIERSWREMKDGIVLQDDQFVLLIAKKDLAHNAVE